MPYKCKGICERDTTTRQSHRYMYERGFVFCKTCDRVRPKPPPGSVRCDCCSSRVRFKPSSSAMCYMRRKAYHSRKNHNGNENHIPAAPWALVKNGTNTSVLRAKDLIAAMIVKEQKNAKL